MNFPGLNPKTCHASSSPKGTLGGLVSVRELGAQDRREHGFFLTWPTRRKKPTFLVVPDGKMLVESPNLSSPARMQIGSEEWPSPVTPRTTHLPLGRASFSQQSPVSALSSTSQFCNGYPACSPLGPSRDYANGTRNQPHTPEQIYQSPFELAGSLLLASQGYPQTIPPMLPPRPNAPRSESIESHRDSLPSLSHSPQSEVPEMSSQSAVTQAGVLQTLVNRKLPPPPPRIATSPSVNPPKRSAQPVPLSGMSLEELLELLPYLDAAIIANDWIPCVQKRHAEVKNTLQALSESNCAAKQELAELAEQLLKIIDTVNDLAKKCESLFTQARELTERDSRKAFTELETARSGLRSALAMLAQRHAQKEADSVHSKLELETLRSTMRQTINLLGDFIYNNLSLVLDSADDRNVQEVIEVIANNSECPSSSSLKIPMSLYTEAQDAFQLSQNQLQDCRYVLQEQNDIIRCQSEELEVYVERFAEVLKQIQVKDHQITLVTRDNGRLRCKIDDCERTIAKQNRLSNKEQDQTNNHMHSERMLQTLEAEIDDQLFARDAEIDNLRRKLAESTLREQKLQRQIRSLIGASQKDTLLDSLPPRGRLKRLLSSNKDPARNAMKPSTSLVGLGLSPGGTDFIPQALQSSRPSSPKRGTSSSSSPVIGAMCDPNIKLSKTSSHQRRNSSVDIPPRPLYEQFKSDKAEIDAAVHNRFAQLPSLAQREESHGTVPHVQNHAEVYQTAGTRCGTESSNYSEISSIPEERSLSNLACDTPPRTPGNTAYSCLPGHQRVLSGITELPEDSSLLSKHSDSAVFEKNESNFSPSSEDKAMYRESLENLQVLEKISEGS